jgi:hypothetical protein
MKYCPTCSQGYRDDSLNFCLTDGTALIMSPTYDSEPTVVMGASAPPRMTQQPDRRGVSSSLAYVGVGLFALIAGGAIVAFLMSRGPTPSNTPLQQTNVIPVNASSVSTNTVKNQVPSSNRSPEVVKYPDSSLQPLTADSVKNLMSVWERAQESRSFASYQACYDSSFVGIKKTKSGHSQSYSYSSWMADRRRMIGSAVNLNIDLSNLQVRVDGDTAIVQFDQYYRSLRYSDWGPKEITVRMTPAGPKIVREELKASYPL